MNIVQIPLDRVTADLANQPRLDDLDESYIDQLATVPDLWPPIVVVAAEAERYALVDGFHRTRAAQRVGLRQVNASVIPMPADGDLFRIAFELNARHGKPLSLRDRKAYAIRLFESSGTLSDREIGRRTGLDHSTVGTLRRGSYDRPSVRDARRSGDLPSDIRLFDPIRFARATKAHKTIAGYIKRLAIALADPYTEDRLNAWSQQPAEIATAVFAAMGADQAAQLLETVESDARFIVEVCAARLSLSQL